MDFIKKKVINAFLPYNLILSVVDNNPHILPPIGKGQIMDLVCKIYNSNDNSNDNYDGLKTEINKIITTIDESNGSKLISLIQTIADSRNETNNNYTLFSNMLNEQTSDIFFIILKNMNELISLIKYNQPDITNIPTKLKDILENLKNVINLNKKNVALSDTEQIIITQITEIDIDAIKNMNLDYIKSEIQKIVIDLIKIMNIDNIKSEIQKIHKGGRYKNTMKGKRKNKKAKRKTRRNR
jgi:hypothetical protein